MKGDKYKSHLEKEKTPSTETEFNQNSKKSKTKLIVKVDYDKYKKYLELSNLNDEEKEQVVEALWQLIVQFVDFGIGVHPISSVVGEDTGEPNFAISDDADMAGDFNTTTAKEAPEPIERSDACSRKKRI